jgi:hypothetical protein
MAKSTIKSGALEDSADVLDIFTDMYIVDPKIENRIEAILNSPGLQKLVKQAEAEDNVASILDEILPDAALQEDISLFKRFTTALRPFYEQDEYNSKRSYLRYLRNVYGFMIHPFEEPPNRVLNIFYPDLKTSWEPSPEHSIELLKRFYLETKLIRSLTDKQWQHVYRSNNPESELVRILYGIRFNPKFNAFLKDIPWMLAEDHYGAPALDTVYWRAPGPELAKKPLGIDLELLAKLVEESVNGQAYRMIVIETDRDDEVKSKKLSNSTQIIDQIEKEGIARIDSYAGISKRENDFVIFQRMIIWPNPGFERYENATKFERLKMAKPPPYLGTIRERAIPLEIPFIDQKLREKK